jgi:hypothetical protein
MSDVHASFWRVELAVLFDFPADLKCPKPSDPKKEIVCYFAIEPPENADFVNLIQLPNLSLICAAFITVFSPLKPTKTIVQFNRSYTYCFCVEQRKVAEPG